MRSIQLKIRWVTTGGQSGWIKYCRRKILPRWFVCFLHFLIALAASYWKLCSSLLETRLKTQWHKALSPWMNLKWRWFSGHPILFFLNCLCWAQFANSIISPPSPPHMVWLHANHPFGCNPFQAKVYLSHSARGREGWRGNKEEEKKKGGGSSTKNMEMNYSILWAINVLCILTVKQV